MNKRWKLMHQLAMGSRVGERTLVKEFYTRWGAERERRAMAVVAAKDYAVIHSIYTIERIVF